MPFTIPNSPSASFGDQAEPDAVDLQVLAAGPLSGVVTGCAVSAQGTPDMTVAVAVGEVLFEGTKARVAAGNLTIGAADGSNPRFDLITVNSSGTKAVTAGTAAANPVFPAIPASSVVVAAIYVPVGTTSIDSTRIVDKRVMVYSPQKIGRAKQGATTYLSIPGVYGISQNTSALAVNQARYAPWIVETPITLDQLSVEVTTAGAASTTARLAVYHADTDWQPTALVVDAGTVAVDTTGAKSATISTTLQPGRYLAAVNSDGTPTMRSILGVTQGVQFADVMGASMHLNSLRVTQTYGAFPDPGTAWGTVVLNNGSNLFIHYILARISTP